jgi:hypothetical protein
MGVHKRTPAADSAVVAAGDITVVLIRHAYTRTAWQSRGVGGLLMRNLITQLEGGQLMIGTWTASVRAIAFYRKHGFTVVEPTAEKDRLLRLYWFCDAAGINSSEDPYRQKQMAASVVMKVQGQGAALLLSVAQPCCATHGRTECQNICCWCKSTHRPVCSRRLPRLLLLPLHFSFSLTSHHRRFGSS